MKTNEMLLQRTFRRFMRKMIANNLMIFLGSIVNGIVISRWLGTEAMGAFQLTLPLIFVVMMFSQILSMGVQNCCAKSLGAGDRESAERYYTTACLVGLPFSLFLAVGMFFCADGLAALLGAEGAAGGLHRHAVDYLQGISFGIPLLLFIPMQVSVLFLAGGAKYAMRAIAAQTVVNIVGALLNVLWLEGGMLGMGLVMSLTYLVSLAVMVRGGGSGCIGLRRHGMSLRYVWPVLRIGLPSAVDRFYKSVQMFVVNHALLAAAPGVAIAAFADINALNNILNPVVMGLSATTLTMAGVFVGEGDRLSLCSLLNIAVKHTVLVTLVVALLVFAAAPQLIGLFVEEGEAFDAAVEALSIYIWYLPLYGVNNVLQKYYLGVNAMKMTYLTSLLDNLLFICLLAWGLGQRFGAVGVWYAFLLAELLTAVTLLLVIACKNGRWPRSAFDYACLPSHVAATVPAFAASVSDMGEAAAASEGARQYLLARGASERDAALMALCIEEMGGNIIRWGFQDGKKHSIDILVTKKSGWTLRIRDDCAAFDPKRWLQIHEADDPIKNIGIRTVCAMADDVRYSRPLGLNYLFIDLGKGSPAT